MLKRLPCFLVCWALVLTGHAQPTTAEKLGYPRDAKLLILHADDLAVAHAEDSASIRCLESGAVSSASIMVPCPWFTEIADYAKRHPGADLGIHLTLTSEWEHYKWGPVASRDSVESLLDANGDFYDNLDSLGKKARLSELRTELRSQIEKALHAGIDITHLDSHMGSCFFRKDFMKVYLDLAHAYRLPCLLNVAAFKAIYQVDISDLVTAGDVVTDHVYMAFPPSPENQRAGYYEQLLRQLQPGLNCIILHAAYDDDEMRAVTVNHPDYGAAWRQADYDFFTSDACKKLLESEHIYLVTWRQIRDKITRSGSR